MCRDPPSPLHRWGAFFADKDVKKKRHHANVDSWQKPDLPFRRIPEGRAAAKQVLAWLKAGGETATSPSVSAAGVTRTSERGWRGPCFLETLSRQSGDPRLRLPSTPVPEEIDGISHNPRLTPMGTATQLGWERCLSVPGLRWEVERCQVDERWHVDQRCQVDRCQVDRWQVEPWQVDRWQVDRWQTVRLACRDGETMAGGMGKPVTGFEPATY